MVDCIVTKYPEIGYELREYSSYDGRGEGAADHGAEVYTLAGELVDTSASMSPATWIMETRIAADHAAVTATAVANLQRIIEKYQAMRQSPKVLQELEKLCANLRRLTGV